MKRLVHGRVEVALHSLKEAPGPRLLFLHELGGRADDLDSEHCRRWPGPVWGLDFTGHGESDRPAGGGYTAEALLGDADATLPFLGEVTVLGSGLGAWIALLLAGSRPRQVRGAILAPGRGLTGGGSSPGSPTLTAPPPSTPGEDDGFAELELSTDIRPIGYAGLFARQAHHLCAVSPALSIAPDARAAWLDALRDHPGAAVRTIAEALDHYASWVAAPCIGDSNP